MYCFTFHDTIIKYHTLLYRYSKAFIDILDYKNLSFRRLFDCGNVAFLEQMRFILAPDHITLRRWISEVKLINLEFEFATFLRYSIGAEFVNVHVSKRIEYKDFAVILVGKVDHAENFGYSNHFESKAERFVRSLSALCCVFPQRIQILCRWICVFILRNEGAHGR